MNNLVEKFKDEKRWVNYRPEKQKDKITKKPISPITKMLASSTNSDDWGTYEQAVNNDKEKIGIVFTPEKLLLGIDIDHCLAGNTIIGDNEMEVVDFLIEANTYCEKSPSGEGLHLFFVLDEPLDLIANRKNNYECYTSGRYFTVTQNVYQEYDELRTINKDEALKLLAMIGYPWGKDETNNKEVAVIVKNYPDDEILEMMFNAQNGIKVKKLYEGNISEYKEDYSSADMALCSHLAFWTGKNADQMERIWKNSPLGQREKTQKRKDYRLRTIKNAIKGCNEVYGDITKDEGEIKYDFLKTDKGRIVLCTDNVLRLMRTSPEFTSKFRYDHFKEELEINVDGEWVQFQDIHILNVQSLVANTFKEFHTVKKEMIYDAIMIIAHENGIDSAIDYLKSIKWDKIPRVDTWLCSTYGVENDEYHRSIGSNWLKGLVKRLVIPGCKFDYVLVIEGPQGTMKSTSLAILGKEWHMETTASTESKDFFMAFAAKAIIEFSEGETLSRTDVKRLKAIITTQVDKYRAPYDKVSRDHPRRCVFAMTTNSSEYLKDETGNRRWLPLTMVYDEANIKWLEENRDQLFAEAYQRVIIDKETVWDFPRDELLKQQFARRITDPNTELVADWYYNSLSETEKNEGVTTLQVHLGAFKRQYDMSMKKYEEMSIANILSDELKLKKMRTMVNGVRKYRWYPPDGRMLTIEDEKSVFKNDIDFEGLTEE